MAEQTHQQHIVNADSIFINNRNDKKSSHIQIGTKGALGDNDLKLNNCNIEVVGSGFVKAADLRTTILKDTNGNAAITLSGGNTLDFNTANIDFNDATLTNFPTLSASNVSSANGFASLDAELDSLQTNKLNITGHTGSKIFVSTSGGGITTSTSVSTSQLASAISNANSALQNFNGMKTQTIEVGGGADKTSNVDFKMVATAMNGTPSGWKYLTLRTPTLSADIVVVLPGTAGTLQLVNGSGNIITDTERGKLNGIETGATADLTNLQVRALVESADDSNVFTNLDHNKLEAIEASADVTDTANVTSAGALMDSELTDLAGVKGVTISTLQVKPSEGAFANGDKTLLDANVAKLTGISFGNNSPHTNATRIGQGTNQLTINNDNSVNSNAPDDGGFLEYNSLDFLLLRKPSASSHWNLIMDRGDRYWSGFRSTHHWDTFDGNGETGLGKWLTSCPGETMFLQYYAEHNINLCMNGGMVGIGGSPDYPFHVIGSVNFNPGSNPYFKRMSGEASTASHAKSFDLAANSTTATSAFFTHNIYALGVITSSDRRIKKDIREVPDNLALEMVRKIPCKYYKYIDEPSRGTEDTIGFIAQEIAEIFPMASGLVKNTLPNEMRILENVSWETITDVEGETKQKLTINDLEDVSGNTKYRFYVNNGDDEKMKEIPSLEDDPKSFLFNKKWDNIYLYGKEINDFHTIDKAKIFTLAFSATQEIDRIQQKHATEILRIQQHATEIANLKAELQKEKNKTIYFEDKLRDIEIRLSNANL